MLSLSSLLNVDPLVLRQRIWDKIPCFAQGGGQAVLHRFNAGALKSAVETGDLPSSQVVVKGFMGPIDVSSGTDTVDGALAVQRVWAEEHALIINGAHSVVGEVGDMAAELMDTAGCTVRANAYRTVLGTFAYPTHWDTHGSVAIQLSGAKRWELFPPVFQHPVEGQTMGTVDAPEIDMNRPAMVVELRAGDVLYVPRGWGHRVVTIDDESVHITFGFYPETELDGLDRAMALIKEKLSLDPEFRAELGSGEGDLEARAAELLATVFEELRGKTEASVKLVG